MESESDNPLLESQREKAGPATFSKFSYQYHWALFRIIEEHAIGNEYAVFMELHEDVVLSNSLNEEKALFEFNQVKTTGGKFTAKSLTKLKNGSSVLGKLVSNSFGKSFSNKLSSLNLVAVNGFSLPFKKSGLDLKKIRIDDLHENTTKELSDAINAELALDLLPTSLHFILPDLPDKRFQDLIIAEISKLVTNLFPSTQYNPVEIYRVLYDDITRKGMISYDITKWRELLNEKALTSNTVTRVINQFTSFKNEAYIQAQFNSVAEEIGLNTIQSKVLEKSFNRYRQNRVGNRSTLQLDISKEISTHISNSLNNGIELIEGLFRDVIDKLPEKITKQFTNEIELKAAIIYELIIQQ